MKRIIISSLLLQGAVYAKSYVYLDLEALYLQRGGATRKVLVNQGTTVISNPGGTVLVNQAPYITKRTGGGLAASLGYEPCFRATVGASSENHGGMFRGMGSVGWTSNKKNTGGNLNFPFNSSSYAPGYFGALSVKERYHNNLVLLEGYFTRDFTPLWENYFAVRVLFGVQYWNVPESAKLTFSSLAISPLGLLIPQNNTYRAKTNNNLGLIGAGLYFQIKPSNVFAFEVIALGGAGGNLMTSRTRLKILNDTTTLRKSSRLALGGGYTFQGTVRAVYRPLSYMELGVGYELMYAGGIALAYKQMSEGVDSRSDNRTHHNSSIWFQGASFRLGFKL